MSTKCFLKPYQLPISIRDRPSKAKLCRTHTCLMCAHADLRHVLVELYVIISEQKLCGHLFDGQEFGGSVMTMPESNIYLRLTALVD